MKTREQYRNNKRIEIEQIDWFIEHIQMQLAFGWLREHLTEKTSCQGTCWKSTNTSLWCHTATWLANQTMPSWCENEEAMFWNFHPLAVRTNNKHLLKLLFKVIRNRSNCLKLPSFFSNSDLLIISKVFGILIKLAYLYVQFHKYVYT